MKPHQLKPIKTLKELGHSRNKAGEEKCTSPPAESFDSTGGVDLLFHFTPLTPLSLTFKTPYEDSSAVKVTLRNMGIWWVFGVLVSKQVEAAPDVQAA